MIKILLFITLAFGILFWLARPYSLDIVRYAVWRVAEGHVFSHGSAQSGDASIGYRTIGPVKSPLATHVPLVLLHGGFGTDLDWYAEIPTLSRHHQLILIDTRGHGKSTLGEQPFSYELLANDVIAVLDDIGLQRVDVAGWSDGGNTGLLLALEHPQRVRRLVAISANAHPDGLLPKVRDALAQNNASGSLPTRLLRSFFSPEPERWNAFATGVTALWRNYPQLSDHHLESITTPVLIVAGSEDDIRQTHLDELALTIPKSQLVVLPGVGHFVPQSAPTQLLQLITDFLDTPI